MRWDRDHENRDASASNTGDVDGHGRCTGRYQVRLPANSCGRAPLELFKGYIRSRCVAILTIRARDVVHIATKKEMAFALLTAVRMDDPAGMSVPAGLEPVERETRYG